MTNFDKEILTEWGRATAAAAIAFILLLLMCAMCGCKSVKYVPKETVRIEYREADTTAIYNRILKFFESRNQRESKSDSLVDRTKETVVLNVMGDTVKLTRTHYVYVSSKHEKELEQKVSEQDSIIKDLRTQLSSVKVDSIQVPYPVERKLTKWEKAKMDFGGIAFGVVIAFVIGAVLVWLAKKFRK